MATFEKRKLSEDSTGSGIYIPTSTPVTIHTTGTSSTVLDEIWIYVNNESSDNSSDFIISIGGLANIRQIIGPSTGLILVVPGLIVSGNGNTGTTITATDNSSTGEVSVNGFINRITP